MRIEKIKNEDVIAVTCTTELKKEVYKRAKANGLTASAYVRLLIVRSLKEEEK